MQFVSDKDLLTMAAKRLRMHMGMPSEHADRFSAYPELDYQLLAEFTNRTPAALRKNGVLEAIREATQIMASQRGMEIYIPPSGGERRIGLYHALKVELG